MSEDIALRLLARALPQLEASFRNLPAAEPSPAIDAMAAVMSQVAERMADNYPYFHPLYAGQMLKPPHPLARAAYALAMGSIPTTMPSTAAAPARAWRWKRFAKSPACLAGRITWDTSPAAEPSPTSKALWIAGQLAPGKRIVASEQAHYTHGRISAVLGLPFTSVPADQRAVWTWRRWSPLREATSAPWW